MRRGKFVMRTDEELSATNPDLVKRSVRKERIQKGLLAAGSATLVAWRLWRDLREDKAKS